jgi:ubiquitin-protein ligase
VRKRRIENEWKLLHELAVLNPGALQDLQCSIGPNGDYFRFRLNQTAGLVQTRNGIQLRHSHIVELQFSRFFPAVPTEAVLPEPVFHPNVDPDNGFVCLWMNFSHADDVAEALVRLQRVIAWDLFNLTPDHLMQPAAAAWYEDASRTIALPCAVIPLVFAKSPDRRIAPQRPRRGRRQRLFLPS